jgi:2,3-diketo-5-methylthio-1-phosphopentane phosphatase
MTGYSIFIDFDFTITTDDVGNRFFTFFSDGENEPVVKRWLNREVSSYTCLTEEARLCRGDYDAFVDYVDRFEIDSGFERLIHYCNSHNLPMYILSDGLDFYIKHILNKYGFGNVPFFSNRAVFTGDGLEIELPYYSEDCPECGNCKGNRIRELKRPDDRVVYIGDGFSDICGVREADLIFAKDDLAKHLKQNGNKFYEYDNLSQVVTGLERIIGTDYREVKLRG